MDFTHSIRQKNALVVAAGDQERSVAAREVAHAVDATLVAFEREVRLGGVESPYLRRKRYNACRVRLGGTEIPHLGREIYTEYSVRCASGERPRPEERKISSIHSAPRGS